MDFGAIYWLHVKGPKASPPTTTMTVELSIMDMPFDEWLQIFLSFQSEHLIAFPKDAVIMPAHIDQAVKMKNAGMQWQLYDVMYRQKRVKRIARGSKKVSGWATLNMQGRKVIWQTGGAKRPDPETLNGAHVKPGPGSPALRIGTVG